MGVPVFCVWILLRILMDEIMNCPMILSLLFWQKKNSSQNGLSIPVLFVWCVSICYEKKKWVGRFHLSICSSRICRSWILILLLCIKPSAKWHLVRAPCFVPPWSKACVNSAIKPHFFLFVFLDAHIREDK